MTKEDKKKLLGSYRILEERIDRIAEEIERWESRAERVTASYSDLPRGEGVDRVQAAVDVLVELRGALYDQLLEAGETRRGLMQAIDSVGEERLRLLLEYRYVDGLTFEQIAERMHYSWRQIVNLHERALGEVGVTP